MLNVDDYDKACDFHQPAYLYQKTTVYKKVLRFKVS